VLLQINKTVDLERSREPAAALIVIRFSLVK